MSTLKPCPFCAAELRIRAGFNSYGHCPTDGCYANRGQIVPLDDERQVAAWNRRAAPAPSSLAGGEEEALALAKAWRNADQAAAERSGHDILLLVDAYIPQARLEVAARAALSPEAPAREVTDAMVEAACSRFVSESEDIWSASVWPEGLDDDGDRGDGGRVRLISEDDQHKIRAAMRFALQDALTPRHEAPASHAFEASHSIQREGGCKVCGHDEASHEAPAEGEGERLLKPAGSKPTRCYCPPDRCDAPVIMGRQTPCIRARSSAPEARDGEAVDHRPECWGSTSYSGEMAHCYCSQSTAAPSADKLRIAVEAMQGAIDWDKHTGYRMPYRVRDPLYAAIDLSSTPDALKAEGA